MNAKEYFGKRILYRHEHNREEIREGVLYETSPSKRFVRIGVQWSDVNLVTVEEELPALSNPKAAPKPRTLLQRVTGKGAEATPTEPPKT